MLCPPSAVERAMQIKARGRSERLNGTLQGRVVNELRAAGIDTIEAANRYLRARYLPIHNETFAHAPRDPKAKADRPTAERPVW